MFTKSLALCLLFFTSGCGHLFYYPSKDVFVPPEKMKENPSNIYFTNSDGIKLHGWHFKNSLTPAKPKALIVFFHGNAQNITSHYMTLLWILKHGYDFFIFDYQGYGQSEGEPTQEGTIKDGKAALKWAHDNYPKVPLVVFAQSLGGAIGLRVVGEMKDEIPVKLMVADSTFYSYRAVARGVLAKSWVTWILQPITYLVLSDKYAPEEYIEKLPPIPLLVIHGDQDQVVPFELGEEIFKMAKDPKEFWRIPEGRHTDVFWRPDEEYRKKFLTKLQSLSP